MEELLTEFQSLLDDDPSIKSNPALSADLLVFMREWIAQVKRSKTSDLIYIIAHDRGNPVGRAESPQAGCIHRHPLAQMFGLRVLMAEIDNRIPKSE